MNEVRKLKFYSWNVRGLNDKNKRTSVRKEIASESPHLICLQETKWEMDNNKFIQDAIGNKYSNYYTVKAQGTAEGLLVAWDETFFS